MAAPTELLRSVPLFNGLSNRDLGRLAQSFKERTFPAGETIATEGTGGVGFFVIGEGEVSYVVNGEEVGRGGPGEYFGEIALIDDGPRSATVTAASDVTAYGLTSWEFKPLVEENAAIAWELLQVLAKRLRAAQAGS
ncbi:MAG TPA: Crp/Fnr family transcriptional regulator [Gaiellaceae bacterium]|nr:Crp/Fnr family transcriptional regulator [Gaiellaceae bacterium]